MERQMNAIVINAYGSSAVLEEATLEIPAVGKKQVLVEVHAAGVNPLDWKIRKGMMKFIMGWKFPKVLGSDVAGVVKEVGQGVDTFKKGDDVFGMINVIFYHGGYAEYAVVDRKHVCLKPNNLSFAEAAAVPVSALTALQVLRDKAGLKAGQRILINGASGGVGTFAVQIAKFLGAHVTGVCSGKNSELVLSLGADSVIDYTKDDFVNGQETYDLVFDTVGNKEFMDCRRVLSSGGKYIAIVPSAKNIVLTVLTALLPGKTCKFVSCRPSGDDLSWLKEKIEGNSMKPVIDRTYPMGNVKEAHDYSESGHARGKVVLIVKQ